MAKILGAHTGGIIGKIIPLGGAAVPSYALACNGQAVSRTTYAPLFAIIGTIYGAGDGSTTFNVPPAAGMHMRSAGTQTQYTFTIASSTVTAGTTYSNNSQTFTVLNSVTSSTTLVASGTGTPTTTGTLTLVSGTGPATIAFSAEVSQTYTASMGTPVQADQMQGHVHQPSNGQAFWTQGSGAAWAGANNAGTGVSSTGSPISDGTNGTPRYGTETRPANFAVNTCIVFI